MDTSTPLVSVYMPTCNRADLLPRAINSVLSQTYTNLELIIADDGSTDNTQKILKKYSQKDNRVRYFRLEKSRGACAARNLAITKANGIYITGIDDDDEWLNQRISYFIQHADKLKNYSFLYADDYLCTNDIKTLYPKKKFSLTEFQKKNIVGNQIFTYSNRLKKIGFDTSLISAQDYDCFYCMVLRYGNAFYIKTPLQILHVEHDYNRITTGSRKILGYLKFIAKHKSTISKSSRKYQIYTLLTLKERNISIKILFRLLTLRNFKRYLGV